MVFVTLCRSLLLPHLMSTPQSTYIPRVPQCLSPRPSWDPPTPSHPSECAPPRNQRGVGHIRLRGGVGESQFPLLEKTFSTLSILCGRLQHMFHGPAYARVDLNPMPEPTLSPSQGLRIWPQFLSLEFEIMWQNFCQKVPEYIFSQKQTSWSESAFDNTDKDPEPKAKRSAKTYVFILI